VDVPPGVKVTRFVRLGKNFLFNRGRVPRDDGWE
jgi:hypothetical protein